MSRRRFMSGGGGAQHTVGVVPRLPPPQDQRVDRFLRELCHDTRQSVATILALASAGQVEIEDREQVSRRLEQIVGQTRLIGSMLEDVLSQYGEVRLVDVCEKVETAAHAAMAGFPGTFRLSLGEQLHTRAVPHELYRAVMNVLNNARRAAGDQGCVHVTVTSTNGPSAVVDIEDDGPGFGNLATQHGIGLAAASRIVESTGGDLEVGRSRLGGALVRMTLPAVRLTGGGA